MCESTDKIVPGASRSTSGSLELKMPMSNGAVCKKWGGVWCLFHIVVVQRKWFHIVERNGSIAKISFLLNATSINYHASSLLSLPQKAPTRCSMELNFLFTICWTENGDPDCVGMEEKKNKRPHQQSQLFLPNESNSLGETINITVSLYTRTPPPSSDLLQKKLFSLCAKSMGSQFSVAICIFTKFTSYRENPKEAFFSQQSPLSQENPSYFREAGHSKGFIWFSRGCYAISMPICVCGSCESTAYLFLRDFSLRRLFGCSFGFGQVVEKAIGTEFGWEEFARNTNFQLSV